MKKVTSLVAAAVAFLFVFSSSGQDSSAKRKVLLVGIDGIQYRMISEVETPNLDSLHTSIAYTGGIVGTPNQQTTISGPGWTTILTGKWAKEHGVDGNETKWRTKAKSVFAYVKEGKPDAYTASVVTWDPIHAFLKEELGNIDYVASVQEAEDDPVVHVVNQIKDHGPDLIFIHLGNVDEVGHRFGFGPEYNASIKAADEQLGRLKEAVEKREKAHNEDWLILVTTDHGRRMPEGKAHGNPTLSEKTIFVSMNKEGNKAFKRPVIGFSEMKMEDLYKYPPQTAIVPTILDFLKIDIKKDWNLDTSSLLQ